MLEDKGLALAWAFPVLDSRQVQSNVWNTFCQSHAWRPTDQSAAFFLWSSVLNRSQKHSVHIVKPFQGQTSYAYMIISYAYMQPNIDGDTSCNSHQC